MSNLLPSSYARAQEAKHRLRLGQFLAGFALLVGLVALASLVPSLSVVSIALDRASLSRMSTSTDAAAEDAEALTRAQAILAQLPLVSTGTPAALIEDVLAKKPSSIALTKFTYAWGDPSTLVIAGTASRSESVNEFRFALSADPRFKTVTVPIGALVGAKDGGFSITVTGTF